MEGEGNRAKAGVPEAVLWLAIILLSSSGSFGLGYLTGKEAEGGDVIIESRGGFEVQEEVSREPEVNALVAAPLPAVKAVVQNEEVPVLSSGGEYVASKSGKSYHLPWCAGAKQIKEENKIYFGSKAEAEAAGYAPAKNCKGI